MSLAKALASKGKSSQTKIENIEYKPFAWQKKLHSCETRYRVVCVGRQGGKTQACIQEIKNVAMQKKGSVNWWIAPSHKQVKRPFRTAINIFPNEIAKVSHSELFIEFINGSRIEFHSAEKNHLDNLRGATIDGIVVFDEFAMIKEPEDVWHRYIRPMLTVGQGKAIFISTPKGRDFFYQLFLRGNDKDDPLFKSFHFTTYNNELIAREEIEEMKSTMPMLKYKQEILAEFVDYAGGAFKGVDRIVKEYNIPIAHKDGENYTMGVDLAKKNDFTVITVLDSEGRLVYYDRFQDVNYETQKKRIKYCADKYGNPKMLVDETAIGVPICDGLRAEGLRVIPITLSSQRKNELVDNLSFGIENQDLMIPSKAKIFIDELVSYEMNKTKHGTVTYSAPGGMHDDCVISLMLAFFGIKKARGVKLWVL
tara:strand:- start:776 stop:2044 length:1269 start_codon:yes stop_codon:yes gene_type:complete